MGVNSTMICHVCGSMAAGPGQGHSGGEASRSGLMGMDRIRCVHADLVRSVALGEEFVLSGSYDLSIKVRSFPMLFLHTIIRCADSSNLFRCGRGRLGNS